ncbi:uncharacterized protein LOC110117288 [Athalia rosae]|uniref:uncharacterized protein LOC110117288 n=1 Tax=Athalia rosae TaxID=37344 RepID=UPI0020346F90|nr:uncharacterized protein LOC110117288 [Athalia rosae]
MADGGKRENDLPMVRLEKEHGRESVTETPRCLYANLIEDAKLEGYTPIFPTAPSYPVTPIARRACFSPPYYVVPIEDSLAENNGHGTSPPPPFNPAFTDPAENRETNVTENVTTVEQEPQRDPYLGMIEPPRNACCTAMKMWLTIAITVISVAIIIRVHQQTVKRLLRMDGWRDESGWSEDAP